MEFFVTLPISLLIFILMGFVIHQKYAESMETKIHLDGKRVVRRVADNINTICKAGDGYSTQFVLPGRIYGHNNYAIAFYSNETVVWMYSEGDTWMASLITSQIECRPGACDSVGGVETINVNKNIRLGVENEDGVIWIERI